MAISGVRKLDGTEREKETGRQRIAYFYWLGKKTTKKEQGLCALALRDYDRAHFPHERIAQVIFSSLIDRQAMFLITAIYQLCRCHHILNETEHLHVRY